MAAATTSCSRGGTTRLFLSVLLLCLSSVVAEEDPEAPEVTDCEVPYNEVGRLWWLRHGLRPGRPARLDAHLP